MAFFFQELVNGVTTGALYALVALGFSMVYGVLKLLNFAHGDLYMVGARRLLCDPVVRRAGGAEYPGSVGAADHVRARGAAGRVPWRGDRALRIPAVAKCAPDSATDHCDRNFLLP